MTAAGRRGPHRPRWSEGLRAALTLFTVAPVRACRMDRTRAGRALMWSPLVGLAVGAAAASPIGASALVIWLTPAGPPGPAGAVLLAVAGVAIGAVLTRGLHLDGLADTADGLGSARTGEAADAVMARPDIGPFGVVTVTLTLLAEVAAVASSIDSGRGWEALLLAAVTGRLAAVHAATPGTPPLRPHGLGALAAGTVPARGAAAWTAAAAALSLVPLPLGRPGLAVHLLAGLAAGLVTAALLRRHAVRRFGGISGDVFGALVEAAAAAALVAMAVG